MNKSVIRMIAGCGILFCVWWAFHNPAEAQVKGTEYAKMVMAKLPSMSPFMVMLLVRETWKAIKWAIGLAIAAGLILIAASHYGIVIGL